MENKLLDETGWKILEALQENARISYADLGKLVNLTAPAVTERIRKMEEAGLITGYHAAVNTELLGAAMRVLIRVQLPAGRDKQFVRAVEEMPEILACYNVTGDISFVLQAGVSSTTHLYHLLDRLERFGQLSTQLILRVYREQRTIKHDFKEWQA